MDPAWQDIGQVVSVDAARRSVRIKAAPVCRDFFKTLKRFWLQSAQESPVAVRVARIRDLQGQYSVDLTPGVSRDMVSQFKYARVVVPSDELDGAQPVDASHRSLVGMRVVVSDGEVLGEVFEMIETPAGGVVRIDLPGGRTAALPLVDAVVQDIDGASGVITVASPGPFLVMDDAVPDA